VLREITTLSTDGSIRY